MTFEEDFKAALIEEYKREAIIKRDKIIIRRLISRNFSDTQINDFTNVPMWVIKKIRKKLKHKKSVQKKHEEIIYQQEQ